MSLKLYRRKRNFHVTPEPPPNRLAGRSPLRFVIHEHHARRLHYDLRLEHRGVLLSWAVPKGPSMNPTDKRLAVHVEDHPLAYRTFRGTIPAGQYGAGKVNIWDHGTYLVKGAKSKAESERLMAAGMRKGHVDVVLAGRKLSGVFSLVNMHRDEKSWLLIKGDDRAATREDIELASGTTPKPVLKHGRQAAPWPVKPMLATLVDQPFDRKGWIFEIKWDGWRALAFKRKGHVTLVSRNHTSFHNRFPRIVDELGKFDHDFVVDGEVVILDQAGRPLFQQMQNIDQWKPSPKSQLAYQVFDLLWLDGYDVQSLMLLQRKELLERLIGRRRRTVRYSDHVSEHGQAFFAEALRQGLEGVMAKDGDSPYRQGIRGGEWLKIKTHQRQEAVIVGFTEPRGQRKNFGALVLGVYQGKQLVYIGHTGTGFDERKLRDLMKQLQPLRTNKSPFDDPPKTNAPVTWVKPKLVCEIAFSEWTEDGRMRQPVFIGLRDDKRPTAVHRELPQAPTHVLPPNPHADQPQSSRRPAAQSFPITHPEKIYFPKLKITKGEVAEYYQAVSQYILPYLKDRPENLLRHPHGISRPGFFHKDMGSLPPDWVKTERIYSESNQKDMQYLVCQDLPSLLYMVNLGCIEINPWNNRTGHLDRPDWMVIDLDPEGVKFSDVITTARAVHSILEELDVPSYPKTSGKSGMHIYVPMGAQYSYDQVKEFGQLIATLVHERLPQLTSVLRSPRQRPHRVYLDYLQNRKGQTLAAPYSLRPVPDASVAMPLDWAEVRAGLDPKQFTIKNALRRIRRKGDLFRPVLGSGIDLRGALERLANRLGSPKKRR